MKARYSATARLAYVEAITFLSEKNPIAANNLFDQIEEGIKNICLFPESGRIVPEFNDRRYREIIVNPYRAQYRIFEGIDSASDMLDTA